MNNIYKAIRKAVWLIADLINVSILRRYPILYFDEVPNVGDQINPYLVKKILNRKPFNVSSRLIKHTVGLGSMFHMANKRSVIWGSGIISDGDDFRQKTDFLDVVALRGELTKKILIESGRLPEKNNVVLGDPGVLMPIFYSPNIKKNKKIGLVPHYVDAANPLILNNGYFHVIDVSLDPESFIDEILGCDFVLSSSLHGLILSDAYGVPNKWITFSDRITGGGFKYRDYYSTTSSNCEQYIFIDSEVKLIETVDEIENLASIKRFLYDKSALLKSFPSY